MELEVQGATAVAVSKLGTGTSYTFFFILPNSSVGTFSCIV